MVRESVIVQFARRAGRPCRASRFVATALALVASGVTGPAAQAPAWRVGAGEVVVRCPLTVGGSFDAKTTALSGHVAADPSQPGQLTGALTVDLTTLDSGIGLRNTHMREKYLETGRGDGFNRAVLDDIRLAVPDVATFAGATTFTGTLLLHGTRKLVRGDARLTRSGSAVRVEATFPVELPEFGVPKPRYLGVGVKDQVQVRVTFTAASAVTATGSSR
jgi:polyisoprenoid-binding protein YceI